jgi:protein-L-isoaspartate(D-aspartate) O-methyltransferase
MLQAVKITPADSVLEVGTGTGYVTACLAQLAHSITSIDIYPEFVDAAAERLTDLGVDNVTLECMDAVSQLPGGKFDAIVISASMPELDPRFVEALHASGRLFVVVGKRPVMYAMLVTRRADGNMDTAELFETDIPPLVTSQRRGEFSF